LRGLPIPAPIQKLGRFTMTFSDKNSNELLGKYKVFIGTYPNSNVYFNHVAADDGNTDNIYDVGDTQFTKGITTTLTLTLTKQVAK
jgi:hypothetical protein